MDDPELIEPLLPLPPTTFHILLALFEEERHGYAIIQDVEARTEGELRLSAEVTRRRAAGDDPRRRYYRLTPFGIAVARAETRRLSQLVRMARAKGLKPEAT